MPPRTAGQWRGSQRSFCGIDGKVAGGADLTVFARRLIGEEVQIDRIARALSDDAQRGPTFAASNMAQASDPNPPASHTAIAMSGLLAPAIGAWMIGS